MASNPRLTSATLLLSVLLNVLRPTSGCNYFTNFKLERYVKGRNFEYNYWPEPEETPDNANEEAVMMIGGWFQDRIRHLWNSSYCLEMVHYSIPSPFNKSLTVVPSE